MLAHRRTRLLNQAHRRGLWPLLALRLAEGDAAADVQRREARTTNAVAVEVDLAAVGGAQATVLRAQLFDHRLDLLLAVLIAPDGIRPTGPDAATKQSPPQALGLRGASVAHRGGFEPPTS